MLCDAKSLISASRLNEGTEVRAIAVDPKGNIIFKSTRVRHVRHLDSNVKWPKFPLERDLVTLPFGEGSAVALTASHHVVAQKSGSRWCKH